MLKIGVGPDGKPEQDYTIIERETDFVQFGRPICVALLRSGVKVWPKGKRESFTVPYDALYRYAKQGSVSIPARSVTDAALARFAKAAEKRSHDK
jgi:hypothetical protein